MMRIGVDTGGTFTDVVLLDDTGLRVHKVRSTPDDPSRAILQGIREILSGRRSAPALPAAAPDPVHDGATREEPDDEPGWPEGLDVVHGSTVATNAVLERKGARVALVATAGFEDVLRIGRQTRRELYNFFVEDRRPLVADGLTLGVPERVGASGEVLDALPAGAIEALVPRLRDAGAESVAICFLHSYVNAAHERHAADVLARAGFHVSASSDVLPEYREFERWSTTVVDAYVTPIMARYLAALEQALGRTRLSVMQSNGGSISAARARAAAVQTILSGPAAGAVGAHAVAIAAGFPKAIGFDMGGTSTDVTLLDNAIGVTTESTVGDFPVRLPIIDIHTVGAGGGSIAYLDAGGALRVGPQSAGADPGPACYGTGTDLTVTDANLLLGRLDPGYFLGGRMSLDVDRARAAACALAGRLGLEPLALAQGVVRVANANMERAIRVVSVQRGFDTREFALVAFGGAGGMHACEIADTLDIGTVVVPRHAGVLSALGMLLAEVTKDYSRSVLRPVAEVTTAWIDDRFRPLEAQAIADLRAEGFEGATARLERSLDVRYVGQSYEITLPFEPEFREAFDRRHARTYGYANPGRATEIVNLRVKAVGLTAKPALPRAPEREGGPPAPLAVRDAWFGGTRHAMPVFHVESLGAGASGRGPALLAGAQATTVVPPHHAFRIDGFGNVVATRTAAARGFGGRRPSRSGPRGEPPRER
jgi:N-methylhydantoinase A/oxoprolinase/acetone carboxylase beta subunit